MVDARIPADGVPRNGYRAVLLDLDGTLLDRTGNVSDRNRAAVRAAAGAGLEVWIATGRSVCATMPTWRALGLATPACCYNGAVLYCGRTERWLSHLPLEDDALAELLEFCRERNIFFVVFHEDWKHSLAPLKPEHARFLDLLEQVRIVDHAAVPRSGATKLTFAGNADDLAEFDRRFASRKLYQERFPLRVIPGFEDFTLVCCDFFSPLCRGKSEAIHFLEAERGIRPEEVIAIGDHVNDLPMIRAAGLGVAMGNAPGKVKAQAKLVIGRHDEDAVGKFLEGLLGI
jgi:Cof subfamily protein (haloacid dehalogenase superfamily)